MKLTKSFTQVDRSNHDQSTMTICIDYDPKDREIKSVEYVEVTDHTKGTTIDISAIMYEQFNDQLDQMIENIDWWEVYGQQKESSYIEYENI